MENVNKLPDPGQILELLDDLIKAEREQAAEIYTQMQNYLKEKTYSEYPQVEIVISLGLARYHIMEKDAQKAFDIISEAEKIAIKHNLKSELLNIKSAIAITYSMRGNHLKAIYLWEELLDTMEPTSGNWQAITNNLIIAYTNSKQFTNAVDLSYKLLKWLDEHDEPEGRISAYINLGNAYGPLKQMDKALKAYEEALRLAEKHENIFYMAFVLGNMAGTLTDLNRLDEALETATRALEINIAHFSDAHIAESYSSIGTIHSQLGNLGQALTYYKLALQLFENCDDPSALASAHLSLGKQYLDMNQLDDAIMHLQKGYDITRITEVNQLRLTCYKHLSAYYSKTGQYKEANEFYRLLTDFQEEQYAEVTSTLISKEEAEYLQTRIEDQNTSYRRKNQELKESNRKINKQTRQLKKSNLELTNTITMLNQLVSVISHDVRGPIMNTATITRLMIDGAFDEKTRNEILHNIVDSLDGMGDLLTEMLFWIETRSSNTGIGRLMRRVDLNSLIEGIAKMYLSQIRQKQIDYHFEAESAESKVITEPNALKIVVRNIISNAIKFTPEGGKVTVSVYESGGSFIIRIADTGIGMNPDEIKHLLKQKLPSKQGTTNEFGMGIGLKLCMGYIRLLKADLRITSKKGKGSDFIITLKKEAGE